MNHDLHKVYEALTSCEKHPVMGKYVEWMNISFALHISNPDFRPFTDLGRWQKGQLNENVGLEDLLKNILENGMRDPFIVGVGSRTSKIRLETGNQRVRILSELGISFIPVVALYSDSQITNTGNGVHQGVYVNLIQPAYHDLLGPYQERKFGALSRYAIHPDLILRAKNPIL